MKFRMSEYKDINRTNFTKSKYKLVYIMVGEDPYNSLKGNIPVKIGISSKPDKRKQQIIKSLKPKDVFVDGVKQTIHITNPQLFCVSLPLAYAEAVEKAAQKALCKLHQERTKTSSKISGYNDWFQVTELLDAASALMLGIEEVEGDISLDKAENYHVCTSKVYYEHEFCDQMQIAANNLIVLFSAISDPCKTSLSDKETLRKSRKKYLLRESKKEDGIPKGENPENWLTLVISLKNCLDKKLTSRLRMPIRKQDLLEVDWNLQKMNTHQVMSLIAVTVENYDVAGIGAMRRDRNALLIGQAWVDRVRRDGSLILKNDINLCPQDWWKITTAK